MKFKIQNGGIIFSWPKLTAWLSRLSSPIDYSTVFMLAYSLLWLIVICVYSHYQRLSFCFSGHHPFNRRLNLWPKTSACIYSECIPQPPRLIRCILFWTINPLSAMIFMCFTCSYFCLYSPFGCITYGERSSVIRTLTPLRCPLNLSRNSNYYNYFPCVATFRSFSHLSYVWFSVNEVIITRTSGWPKGDVFRQLYTPSGCPPAKPHSSGTPCFPCRMAATASSTVCPFFTSSSARRSKLPLTFSPYRSFMYMIFLVSFPLHCCLRLPCGGVIYYPFLTPSNK